MLAPFGRGDKQTVGYCVGLTGEVDVGVKPALAPHEPRVLESLDPLSDSELSHPRYRAAGTEGAELTAGSTWTLWETVIAFPSRARFGARHCSRSRPAGRP